MPSIRIDLASPVPAYRQIADSIRALFVAEQFSPGDHLPTVRQLGMDLGIHHNTVAEAYRMLAEEGWLELGRRRGATVLARKLPKPTAAARAKFSQNLRELVAHARSAGLPTDFIRSELSMLARDD